MLLKFKSMKRSINKQPFSVGVIAGTHFDTKLGANCLRNVNIKAFEYPISETPQQQTLLQLDPSKLTKLVNKGIEELLGKGVKCILIYCNSLSSVVNLHALRSKYQTPILTPMDVYAEIATDFSSYGLLAANSQCVGSIERLLLSHNPLCTVISIGMLPLVDAIESNKQPQELIKNFNIIDLFEYFIKQQCDAIILGCTHFHTFALDIICEIHRKHDTKIIEPTNRLIERIINIYNALEVKTASKEQATS